MKVQNNNYDELVIPLSDYQTYQNGHFTNSILNILNKLVKKLDPEEREEFVNKWFRLEPNPEFEEDPGTLNLLFRIRQASEDLQEVVHDVVPYVICVK
jgi:hypothetical protein